MAAREPLPVRELVPVLVPARATVWALARLPSLQAVTLPISVLAPGQVLPLFRPASNPDGPSQTA